MATDLMSRRTPLFILIFGTLMLGACGSSDVLIKSSYSRGVDYYDQGNYHAAIAEYQASLADRPDDHRVYYNLALCFHDLYLLEEDPEQKTVFHDKALAAYRRSQTLTDNKAKAQVAEARLLWDAGHKEEALTLLSSIQGDDGSGPAMPAWTRGALLMGEGRSSEAQAAFESALAADENYLPALTALAQLHIDANRPEAAEALIRRGLKKSPHDVTLLIMHARMAEAAARQSDPPEARDAWQECLTRWRMAEGLVPADWELLLGVATCAEALGEKQMAVRYLWKARDNASDEAIQRRGANPHQVRADIKRRLLALYPDLSAEE